MLFEGDGRRWDVELGDALPGEVPLVTVMAAEFELPVVFHLH